MVHVSVLYPNTPAAGFDHAYAPPFVAVGHLMFRSVEDLQKPLHAHGPEPMADLPNYTSIQPLIQVSEVSWSWPS